KVTKASWLAALQLWWQIHVGETLQIVGAELIDGDHHYEAGVLGQQHALSVCFSASLLCAQRSQRQEYQCSPHDQKRTGGDHANHRYQEFPGFAAGASNQRSFGTTCGCVGSIM